MWSQGGFQEQTGNLALYAVNLALNLAWMPVSLPSHSHRGTLYKHSWQKLMIKE